jgi:hypothetical protein
MRSAANLIFFFFQETRGRAARGCPDRSPRTDPRMVRPCSAVRGSKLPAAGQNEMRLRQIPEAPLFAGMEPSGMGTARLRFAMAVFAVVAALGFSGCATMDGAGEIGHYEVSVKSTPFYSYWSGRGSGPDFTLPQGTHLVALKREFGYTRVVTDSGQLGYVTPKDLTPTRPPAAPRKSRVDFAALQRLPWGGGRGGVSSANGPAVIGDGSLFGGNDLPPLSQRDPLQPDNFPPGFRINVRQRKVNEPVSEARVSAERKPPAKTKSGTEAAKPGFRVNIEARQGA